MSVDTPPPPPPTCLTAAWRRYGDATGLMGACCADRCPNTAHAWQMGWTRADQLDGASLKPGQTYNATLATQATTVRSAIRVLPTWNSAAAPMFIGFRTVGAPGTGRHHSYRFAACTLTIVGAPV